MLAKDFSFTIYEVDDILNIAKDALIKTKSGAYRASLLGHGAAFANEAQDILSGLAKPRAMMKSSIQRYHNIHEMYDKRWMRLIWLLFELLDPEIKIEDVNDAFMEIAREIKGLKPDLLRGAYHRRGDSELIPKIIDSMWFVYAFAKKDLSMLSDISSSFTDANSDTQKLITEVLGILRKYNCNIFNSKYYNLPKMPHYAEESFYFIKKRLADPNFKILNQAPMFVKRGNQIVKNAAQDAKDQVKEKANELAEYVKSSSTSYIKEVMYKDLFKMFDLNQSGSLWFAEFQDLSKYMGIQLDKERALKMFSMADKNKDNFITLDEFPEVMKLLTEQIALDTLRNLNLTSRDLIMFAVLTLLYLVLALIFIFFGIFTFSRADGFSAVINSIMPLIAGGVAALRSMDLYDRLEHVKEYIEEFIRKMRRI